MSNFENEVKSALKKALYVLRSNNQFKDFKALSICYVCAIGGIKLSLKDTKETIDKLIKNDEITIFGGLYSKFDPMSKELIKAHLKDDSLYPWIVIGLPEDKEM